jgi:hypothetical protein
MWLNAVAALILAACVAAGAWSGALATGLRIATLLLAYAAAALLRAGARPGCRASSASRDLGHLAASSATS